MAMENPNELQVLGILDGSAALTWFGWGIVGVTDNGAGDYTLDLERAIDQQPDPGPPATDLDFFSAHVMATRQDAPGWVTVTQVSETQIQISVFGNNGLGAAAQEDGVVNLSISRMSSRG